jgi:hypothetical protein
MPTGRMNRSRFTILPSEKESSRDLIYSGPIDPPPLLRAIDEGLLAINPALVPVAFSTV